MHDLAGALALGRRLAEEDGRADLDGHLRRADAALATRAIPVVVVGEFKRGKSTLVNALLQTGVCPVDADIVTAVPTMVRCGARADGQRRPRTGGDDGEVVDPRATCRSSELAVASSTELADPADAANGSAAVEVGLPHRLLRTGLQPGRHPGRRRPGLARTASSRSGALRAAAGVVFVTDASRSSPRPRSSSSARPWSAARGPCCVVTKTDLYPAWRRIVELDRGHLRARRASTSRSSRCRRSCGCGPGTTPS